MMVAYRIDTDLRISLVENEIAEMDARGWDWDCLNYSDRDDVWCNDRGLFEADLVLAWIGQARRIPLPAYIRGADGEDSCDPHIAITDVLFGSERDQSPWPVHKDSSGRWVRGVDPTDVIPETSYGDRPVREHE